MSSIRPLAMLPGRRFRLSRYVLPASPQEMAGESVIVSAGPKFRQSAVGCVHWILGHLTKDIFHFLFILAKGLKGSAASPSLFLCLPSGRGAQRNWSS